MITSVGNGGDRLDGGGMIVVADELRIDVIAMSEEMGRVSSFLIALGYLQNV